MGRSRIQESGMWKSKLSVSRRRVASLLKLLLVDWSVEDKNNTIAFFIFSLTVF